MNDNISILSNPFAPGQVVFDTTLGGNRDIISTIEKALPGAVTQTKNISSQFQGQSILETASNIWYWLKSNVQYQKDDDDHQIAKYPSKLLSDRTADCKSFALFTAAILKNLNVPFVFRYINQDGGNIPKHVYIVAYEDNHNPVYIDLVHSRFNEEPGQIKFKKDYNYNTMRISAIAGLIDNSIDNSNPYKNFLNNKINAVYGIGDLFSVDTFEDVISTVASGGTDVKSDTSLLSKINPFGAPKVSTSNSELFVDTSPNSNNIYRVVFQGFNRRNDLSNAYNLGNIIPGTMDAFNKVGVPDKSFNTWEYNMNNLYNMVGGNWEAFKTQVKNKYTNIINGTDYWEATAYKDLLNKGFDKFLAQFGVSTSTSSAPVTPVAPISPPPPPSNIPADSSSSNTVKYIAYGGVGLGILGAIFYFVRN